jgi:hypothetical protein
MNLTQSSPLPNFNNFSTTRWKERDKNMERIPLGIKVKDRITGYTGIATARTVYLNGSPRLQVQAEGLTDDLKPIEPQWCDEAQLDAVSP